MIRFLLDVNLLVAMHLPGDREYERVQHWFARIGSQSFATCAITQAGFVRVSSLLAIKDRPIDFSETSTSLRLLASLPGHFFWPMDLPYLEATAPFQPRMHGYRQITDAYLLGLARHHGGKLATLDRGILHVAGPEFRDYVELVA